MNDNPWNESAEQPPTPANAAGEGKDRALIEKLLMSANKEQRRTRRWGIFFKSLTFLYLFVILIMFSSSIFMDNGVRMSNSHTAVVEVDGVIAKGEVAGADFIVSGLRRAFEDEGTKGVILSINSPGGSPVQAGYVYDEIKRLRGLHSDIKVYAAIADVGASGAYYIAAAADEVYADKASLVGSIGVISSTFGFVDAMEKLGVERRLYTAGENKGFLDPFSPSNEKEVEFWQSVLEVTHQQFIAKVREGRGDRLKETDKIFSGLIWSGEQALELGLIDGLGSAGYIARELIGEENIVNFTPRRSPLEELTEKLGVSIGRSIATYMGMQGTARLY